MASAWSDADVEAMRAALLEAETAADEGEVPVGAVVVLDDRIIGRGHNSPIASADPSAHAEVSALRAAGRETGNYRMPDATLYVTLEPCVMCTGAIVQSRIRRVVFAAYDEKAGALGSAEDLSDSRALNHRFEINGGLLAEESRHLLRRFFAERR